MTAAIVHVPRPWIHRAALRIGRFLTEWGSRQPDDRPTHAEQVAVLERSRERAAHTVPQLPR